MRARDFVLIQISDIHLLADPRGRLHGWDNQAALDAVLAHVGANYPGLDGLLLTGDLVHDESAPGYRRLARQAAAFGVPVYAIPGNHDDPIRLREAFGGVGPDGAHCGPWRLHCLDSRIPDSDAGRLGAETVARLGRVLDQAPAAPTLIAVHHPPAGVGAPWLDAMGLADGDALLGLAGAHRQVRAIVCGHVHHAGDRVCNGFRQLTAPAVTRQFLAASREPAMDTRACPGYRVLRLGRDGVLATRVRRVAAARSAGGPESQ